MFCYPAIAGVWRLPVRGDWNRKALRSVSLRPACPFTAARTSLRHLPRALRSQVEQAYQRKHARKTPAQPIPRLRSGTPACADLNRRLGHIRYKTAHILRTLHPLKREHTSRSLGGGCEMQCHISHGASATTFPALDMKAILIINNSIIRINLLYIFIIVWFCLFTLYYSVFFSCNSVLVYYLLYSLLRVLYIVFFCVFFVFLAWK